MAETIEALGADAAGEAVIRVAGRFTFTDYTTFRAIVGETLAGGPKKLAFDLRELEFLDSAALGMLLLARDEAGKINAPVAIRGAAGQVERVLDVARFKTLFAFED